MRIRDWSSDVCSSDLRVFFFRQAGCDACQHFSAQTRASYAFGQPISFGQASLFNSLERNLYKRLVAKRRITNCMSSQHPLEPAALYRMIPGYRGEFTVASGLLRPRCQRQRLGGFETALRAQKISGLDERVATRIERSD